MFRNCVCVCVRACVCVCVCVCGRRCYQNAMAGMLCPWGKGRRVGPELKPELILNTLRRCGIGPLQTWCLDDVQSRAAWVAPCRCACSCVCVCVCVAFHRFSCFVLVSRFPTCVCVCVCGCTACCLSAGSFLRKASGQGVHMFLNWARGQGPPHRIDGPDRWRPAGTVGMVHGGAPLGDRISSPPSSS